MIKFKCNMFIFISIMFLNTASKAGYDPFAESNQNTRLLMFGQKSMRYADVSYSALINFNLTKVNLTGSNLTASYFFRSNLEEACLQKVHAKYAKFSKAYLKNADLSYGKFCYGHFFDVNLEGAIVTGANFSDAIGLTNKQKQYLRENGAIDVPQDLTEEESLKEKLKIENSFSARLERGIDFFFKIIGVEFAIDSFIKILDLTLDGAYFISHFVLIDLWKKIGNGTIKTAKQLKEFLSKKETLELVESKG